ncbi:glycosyltransferase family 4 protein [Ornithinimicrobium sediminis]|uniref:glycosyltransferase family 4 protein n=1 Tax=Ornithinimicrobium sediminis TaxID=2904603 RepID=UPI001E604C16|nr:glycosyltransferase family 4 protein [Ornithinimicrobium sediminis]MCE0485984.1 glycosyltransferase family 4 protein [Ornithinimicrobium sediminis]
MKIVYLARFLPAEGSTVHLYALAEGMVRRGHEVVVLSAGPGLDEAAIQLFRDSAKSGVQHRRVRFPLEPSFTRWGKVRQLGGYLLALPPALIALHLSRPDVIHVHYPVTSFIAKLYGWLAKTPTVATHHVTGIPRHPLNRRAHMAIAISEELRDELVTTYGYRPNAVRLIFNGVDEALFAPATKRERQEARAALGVDDSVVAIAQVGRLTYVKGLDLLLDAVEPLLSDTVRLLMVGGSSAEAEDVLQRLSPNARRFVLHSPFTSDVRRIYAALDALVLASRREGFPLVTIEAMMMGIPVIRTRTEGASVQVEEERTGILVPVDDVPALREALGRFISMAPEERRMMGLAAAERASTLFSSDRMIEQTLEVYLELIDRGP